MSFAQLCTDLDSELSSQFRHSNTAQMIHRGREPTFKVPSQSKSTLKTKKKENQYVSICTCIRSLRDHSFGGLSTSLVRRSNSGRKIRFYSSPKNVEGSAPAPAPLNADTGGRQLRRRNAAMAMDSPLGATPARPFGGAFSFQQPGLAEKGFASTHPPTLSDGADTDGIYS